MGIGVESADGGIIPNGMLVMRRLNSKVKGRLTAIRAYMSELMPRYLSRSSFVWLIDRGGRGF